jgi:hypothetical protein
VAKHMNYKAVKEIGVNLLKYVLSNIIGLLIVEC